MNYSKWFEEAKDAIKNRISTGQVFEVKDLFQGSKWNELTAGEKKGFGRYFSNQYKEGLLPGLEKVADGKTHHSRYQKQK